MLIKITTTDKELNKAKYQIVYISKEKDGRFFCGAKKV
jgi:hypothetical protein